MPPSPSLRCSSIREHKMENIHKRGQSFESGLTLRAKDDDLALFNDMQNKERESFLLHPADDFDDSLSKLRYLSDFKLGITIPAQGGRSDLLYADGEKNDYDWLLTPPDTPLFPSLDDEEPQPHKLPHRGRPRSQPINFSRSLCMNEKTNRSSRSSASPLHLSPSPRPSNNHGQLMSRSSSATCSSPPPILRHATPSPSRRPSTPPPNRPSTPSRRSSTPMPRRMSTGSSGQAPFFVRRGTSPMRVNRGNSASPKLRGWQSNIPGFPSDAPPNLRTSLSDRPSPHTRGLSPSPRRGRGRHSLSPASGSASSSHSNERDVFTSYSKGSVVSSGDDDVDSLHSLAISSSPPTRRNGMSGNSRPLTVSKKPSRTSPANSMPKRSFEPVIRQMDQRKTQNMFRPLLSSVPAMTFYAGKANNTQRPMFSRNSSLTTSTSASSDHGASVAPDMEGSEHGQNDLTGEWERARDSQIQEEVFIIDKVDGIIVHGAQELQACNPHSDSGSFDAGMSKKVDACAFEGSMVDFDGVAGSTAASESTDASGDASVVAGCEIMAICSKCGRRFHLLEVNGKIDVCQECVKIDGLFAVAERLLPPTAKHNQTVQSEMIPEMDASVNEVQLSTEVPKLPESGVDEVVLGQHKNKIEKGDNSVDNNCSAQLVIDQSERPLSDQHLNSQQDVNSTQSGSVDKFGDAKTISQPSFGIDNPEAKGISVLLPNQLSCNKWPVVQSRVLSATNILCAEPFYARDSTSAMKHSIGRDTASTSSVDLGSSRQTNVHMQCQYSSRKIEKDSVRSDTDAKSQCSGSHSELILNSYGSSVPPNDDTIEYFINFTKGVENETFQETILVSGELDSSLDYTDFNSTDVFSCRAVDSDSRFNADCCVINHTRKDTSGSQLLSRTERCQSETLSTDNRKDEDLPLRINSSEDPCGESDSSLDIGVPNGSPDSLIVAEQSVLNGPACQSDISDVATHGSSIVILESQNDHDSSQDLHTERAPGQVPSNADSFHKCSVSTTSEKGDDVSTSESGLVAYVHLHEESTVIVADPMGHTSRSLTLAEATDTILFCSSIIHDIVYKAATIGMEKELAVPPATSRPTVTILGKSFDCQNDMTKNPNRSTLKSQKFKRKKLETQAKSPLTESEINVAVQESTLLVNSENIPKKAPDTIKPPKLESKCNCTVM